jgi:serine/threonine-protein kinase
VEERTIALPQSADVDSHQTLDLAAPEDPAEEKIVAVAKVTRPPTAKDRTLALEEGASATGDQTLDIKAPRQETGGAGKADDASAMWDVEAPVRPATLVGGPDRTVPLGAETPAVRAGSASTAKSAGAKRRKDPLGGKTVVAGYEILGELGRGGMGVVYKARQPGANRIVALKMVLASGHAGTEALVRFRLEAEAIAQLQHPHIVQLYEVGQEDDCPFFSLEFIDGESLSRKIENTPQSPRAAARVVERLAEGMHFAHQRGIIHRDLKPANILLTKDGVPKITDFGLAKRFEDRGDAHTRTGAIMGTPSYMAPEQAQGRTKHSGPAADIYSLGAILYDMLTGRPPFRGTTLLETLQQVQSVEPVPPMRLQPSLPADLQTICLKALEKEPDKRYRTAGELAEDLRRFQAGEPILARPTPWYERGWKWARRRPALAGLVAVSVLGFLSLLTLGALWLDSDRRASETERLAADQRAASAREKEELARQSEREQIALRKAAERNFQRAKAAVDQMLSEVGQERLRYIPQMEKVRRDLLKKAKAFYDEFLAEQSAAADIRWEAGLAQERVGDILEMLGEHHEAAKAYDSALGLMDGLVKEHPGNAQYEKDLANLASSFGTLLKDLKRNQEAEKKYRLALAVRQTQHARNPQAADLALELAKSHNNLGNVLAVLGKATDAATEFETGRKLLAPLANDHGALYRSELARTLRNLGMAQKTLGRADAAEKALAEANRIWQELTAKVPEVPEHRRDLARSHALLGDALRDTNAKKAEEHYGQSIQVLDQLAKDFPSVPVYRQELAAASNGLAILLQALGRHQEADNAYDQALELQRKAVRDFPHLPDLRRDLGSSLNNRGVMLLKAGRAKEGEAVLVKAMDLFAALHAEHQDVPEYAIELAGTCVNLGSAWQGARPKDALGLIRRALGLREKLATGNPGMTEYQEEVARIQGNLALMLLGQRPEEARSLLSQAAGTFTRLSKDNPRSPDYRHQLAVAHHNLGNTLRALAKGADAEKEWRQAIALYHDLVRDFEDMAGYAFELGKRYNDLAIFLVDAQRFSEAEQAWRDGMAVQEKLVAGNPERPEYRADLGRSEGNLGILFARQGNVEAAERQYRQAIASLEKHEPKLAATPAMPGYIGELVKIHSNLANLMTALNKPAEAEKSWLRALELREKLVQAFPSAPSFRLELVGALNDIGNRVMPNQKFDLAKAVYTKAVEHLRELTREPGTAPQMWSNLYLMQLNLAASLVGLKDHAGACRVVRELAPELKPKERQDHRAAAILARCVELAQRDGGLAQEKRQELAGSYADQAVNLLRQAISNGFSDVEFLRKNEDLEAIRGREDFRQLLGEVQTKKQ